MDGLCRDSNSNAAILRLSTLSRFSGGSRPAIREQLVEGLVGRLDRQRSVFYAMLGSMQKWEYKVFASHLDPAELVVLLDESGREGWELVTLVAVVEHLPSAVIEPAAAAEALKTDEFAEVVPVQAFRYIFKRSLAAL